MILTSLMLRRSPLSDLIPSVLLLFLTWLTFHWLMQLEQGCAGAVAAEPTPKNEFASLYGVRLHGSANKREKTRNTTQAGIAWIPENQDSKFGGPESVRWQGTNNE